MTDSEIMSAISAAKDQLMAEVEAYVSQIQNEVQNAVFNLANVPKQITQAPYRTFPRGADHPWGLIAVSGASVTIAAGEFESGNGSTLATTQQTLIISNDASYIGLQYDPSSGLSLIPANTAKPVSGDGVFRTWLYFFSFDGTNAFYVRHNLTGSWHAALFAASTT